MTPSARSVALFAALALAKAASANVLPVPPGLSVGQVPARPGQGAQLMFVRSAFGGPYSLADARELIEGRAFVPAFDVFCALTPYVDFSNGTVLDSFGREAPTVLCLPFIDPERAMSAAKCREHYGFPRGRYYQNGGAVLRVAGLLAVREAGTYTLAWGHDDGFAMTLGDLRVFEYTDPTGSRVDYRALSFTRPGLYPFQLDWFDGGGGALIDWYISRGEHQSLRDGGFELVSPSDLYPSGALPCTDRCERCPPAAALCDYDHGRCYACDSSADCAECEACESGRCRPAREVPDADLPARCRSSTDSGSAPPDIADATATPNDSAGLDATDTQGDVPGGCGCRMWGVFSLGRGYSGFGLLLAALALTLGRASGRHRRRRL